MLEIKSNIPLQFYGIKELLEIYEEIDFHIENLKKDADINCIEGCGQCCEIPSFKIETTIFESIPLAIYLWDRGEAEIFLKKNL